MYVCACNRKINIFKRTNLVVTVPMPHTKFQGHRPFWFQRKREPYMDMAAILVMWHTPYYHSPIRWSLHMKFGFNRPRVRSLINNLHLWHSLKLRVLIWLTDSTNFDETTYSFEISTLASRGIILSRHQTTKMLRLRGCAGWSATLLFAYSINRFSHDVAYIID